MEAKLKDKICDIFLTRDDIKEFISKQSLTERVSMNGDGKKSNLTLKLGNYWFVNERKEDSEDISYDIIVPNCVIKGLFEGRCVGTNYAISKSLNEIYISLS